MKALLSTTYFGPVQWYQKLCRYDAVSIEQYESFQKQTYRNRCIIATTQGPQALTVPVERSAKCIRDIRISDHGDWRRQHWHALVSAYGDSPFFEYYQDDLHPFFDRRWTFLIDFNEDIRRVLCQLLDVHPIVSLTTAFQSPAAISAECADLREAIRPKNPLPDADFQPRPYYQVFQQKHGFLPNLSILDLLFNMGPESIFWLLSSRFS